MKILFGVFLSYLVGSIPTGYLVGKKVRGIDIRTTGSGNVGATNVFRVIGKKWGIAVLVFDMLKGFAAANYLPFYFTGPILSPFLTSLLFGLTAILGHTWTVWLRFKGGKGVATSAGVSFALVPIAALFTVGVWSLLFIWKRFVSLASLGAALSFPLWVFIFCRNEAYYRVLFGVSLWLSLFIFYTHRENIRRLLEGREKKLI